MVNSRKTIFLVDDNKSNLALGKKVLSELYNIFTFNSGVRLFQLLTKITPDLILLDVEMPEMDGYEVLKLLKRDASTMNIPVIFLTALASDVTELKGLSLGAVDYIAKPFSPPLLLKRIELHLQLIDYRNNLEEMVERKTREVVVLKNAVLKTTAELVEHRDTDTGSHIERTQKYIEILIRGMKKYGVYDKEISRLDENLVLQSSQLHDVGKISIRDSILLKPGKLTPEEFEEMKAHTTFGETIIEQIKKSTSDSDFLEYAGIFALHHHEKWDGSGYPNGLKGIEIPLLGRIMAIADVYDALVTNRPYKKGFPHEEAVITIEQGRGSHFDPALVDLFSKVHPEFENVLKLNLATKDEG